MFIGNSSKQQCILSFYFLLEAVQLAQNENLHVWV